MSCGVGCRCGWDPMLLWLWCRPTASALIRPLAWEPPHATGSALKRQKQTEHQGHPAQMSRIEIQAQVCLIPQHSASQPLILGAFRMKRIEFDSFSLLNTKLPEQSNCYSLD